MSDMLQLTCNMRCAAGRPAASVQWGAWQGVGLVATSAAVLGRMRRSGMGTLRPWIGLYALGRLLQACSAAQVLIRPPVSPAFHPCVHVYTFST